MSNVVVTLSLKTLLVHSIKINHIKHFGTTFHTLYLNDFGHHQRCHSCNIPFAVIGITQLALKASNIKCHNPIATR